MTDQQSYCRLCGGVCGTRVTVDGDGRVATVRGDKQHPMTSGYACIKGLQAPELHNSPSRLLHPLKRLDDGRFVRIPLDQALDEIAERLRTIRERFGPSAIGLYRGTQNYQNLPAFHMAAGFLKAIGSRSFYSTMTIDQSAKWVSIGRLGRWAAGLPAWEESDVWLFAGYNPLVSVQGGSGFPALNPTKRIQEAKARGLSLIVVDPRQSETARYADLHLQIYPGQDAALAAGLLHVILTRNWHDDAFCRDHVEDLESLRRAVAPFAPDVVAARAGIAPADLVRAAELFARIGRKGAATTGTGPDMGPHSNLAEHLYECLNVVCGRYRRAGESIANPGVLGPRKERRAEVIAPRRPWEDGEPERLGYGRLFGERMSNTISEEILRPGEGSLRALLSLAGNPVAALPGQRKTVEAFRALDLLVAIDPVMTQTARLAHYVLAPALMYERPDITLFNETFIYPRPFAQYTPAVARPPEGSEVVEEWRFFWELAERLDLDLRFAGEPLGRSAPPTTEDLLDRLARDSQVPLSQVRNRPGGAVFDLPPQIVQPPSPKAGRFQVAPQDLVAELSDTAGETETTGRHEESGESFTHLLAVRRIREVVNSAFHEVEAIRRRMPHNRAHLHPDDLAALGLGDGQRVTIESAEGRIPAMVETDASVKPGVVSMSHCWGGLPDEDDYDRLGSSTNLLVSADRPVETINAMARLTGIPVRIIPA